MSPFWQNVELLPSSVREKAREKPQKSPEEYAEDREKFQEGLQEAHERKLNEKDAAEVLFYIESNEEELKEKMSNEKIEDTLQSFVSYDAKQWGDMKQAFAEANFDMSVNTNDEGHAQISVQLELPDGNVSEKLQLNQQLQDALVFMALGQEKS